MASERAFVIAGNWWDRRHDVSKVGYVELVFGGWLALGVEFLFLSLSVLIVMGLARAGRRLVVDPRQPRVRRDWQRSSSSYRRS